MQRTQTGRYAGNTIQILAKITIDKSIVMRPDVTRCHADPLPLDCATASDRTLTVSDFHGSGGARRLASKWIAFRPTNEGEPMRRIGMLVAAAVAVLTLVTAPITAVPTVAAAAPASAAAYPTSDFLIRDGAGGYFAGTVTWYNRSVNVAGDFNANGCERVYASAHDARKQLDERSTSLHCGTQTSESFPLYADVPGGAALVYIQIAGADGRIYGFTNCQRATLICD
ncbi:hypothetical protein ACFT2C_04720 [Promicromonospora sp. NPDC057138]|uniref:hypothetical protein n=1 Tax=Promicromonospora sp. NPDC057138 TaxID=3346031 RepID=UPI00363A78FA